MSAVGYFAVYIIIWWVVLFAVLPQGVSSQHEVGEFSPGTDPGAPTETGLKRKFYITTGIAAAVWFLFFVLVETGVLTLESIANLSGGPLYD